MGRWACVGSGLVLRCPGPGGTVPGVRIKVQGVKSLVIIIIITSAQDKKAMTGPV